MIYYRKTLFGSGPKLTAVHLWQCRYKVDNKWIRSTTKETQLDLAVNRLKRASERI